MRILAFDSATVACSAAVWCDGAVRAHRSARLDRGHAEALMPMVVSVMAEAGLRYPDLDLVAVTVGPGTFTGVRIGLAAARGLALASGLPVAGITTFEALARAVPAPARRGRRVVAALDARRDEVYLQAFRPGLAPLGPPRAVPRPQLAQAVPKGRLVLAGTGAGVVREALAGRAKETTVADEAELPDAAFVAKAAAIRYQREGVALPREAPGPLYLRAPGARLPDQSGRGR
ncbi:MAG: tRNA (adenosine(37)-N6)-threonylcarbamoyltransferase complex dimerization subunit type 1 TsaB [Alphaproteobacteria bacterium]